MTMWLGVVGCALLFALAAVALPRRRRSCGGSCGTCASACSTKADAPRAR